MTDAGRRWDCSRVPTGGTVLRDSNRRRLLALLQDHGALTRADLVRRSGISRAT
ncbi:MAG: winged helix-turn-helix domain-containing protein, partial [Actinobacteria bacterium]